MLTGLFKVVWFVGVLHGHVYTYGITLTKFTRFYGVYYASGSFNSFNHFHVRYICEISTQNWIQIFAYDYFVNIYINVYKCITYTD